MGATAKNKKSAKEMRRVYLGHNGGLNPVRKPWKNSRAKKRKLTLVPVDRPAPGAK